MLSFFQGLKKFIVLLLYENGSPSRTGLAALILAIMPPTSLVLITFYLTVRNSTFGHYQSFVDAMLGFAALGCGLLGGNKFIHNKYSSPNGKPFVKNKDVKEQQV